MGEDERLAEMVRAMGELRVELGKHAERQAALAQRMEERDAHLREILRAELEGYLRGQIDSVNHNINQTYRELSDRMAERHVSSTGKLAAIAVVCSLLSVLVATLLAERFGFITRLPGP